MARKKANISPKAERSRAVPAFSRGNGAPAERTKPSQEQCKGQIRRGSKPRCGNSGALDLGVGGGLRRIEGEELLAQVVRGEAEHLGELAAHKAHGLLKETPLPE